MTSWQCAAKFVASLVLLTAAGCQSPYHADRGALLGGLTGAGVGAIVGDAVDQPLAGTAIGAGIGALTGGMIGAGMDEVEARNRAEIEARMGRGVAFGAVTVEEVITMTKAGVASEVIATHVSRHGLARPLQTNDLIQLQQNGVAPSVVQAMQTAPPPNAMAYPAGPPGGPPPVIVQEHYYGDPWGPPPPWYRMGYRHRHRHRPGVSWGFSVTN